MEVKQVLHMNKGNGETSYAKNSTVQSKIISVGKAIIDEAVLEISCNNVIESMGIADLGCSSGPNTLSVISDIMDVVQATSRHLGRPVPEFRLFLNDLYSNDFNYIFMSLPAFYKRLKEEKGIGSASCFISAVPGSFYGRLFPSNSLHFVHSSSSLHWLSQGLIEEEKLDSFNAPYYAPCAEEIKEEIQKEGSFIIDRLEAFEIDWDGGAVIDIHTGQGKLLIGQRVAKTIRAVVESMLESHFEIGQDLMDVLFSRYAEIVGNHLSKTRTKYIDLVMSLIKKG